MNGTGHRVARAALRALADPDARLLIGLTGVVLSGRAVHNHTIGPRETAAFQAVNQLPDELFPPAWLVMQAGTLAAGPVAGAVAWRAGKRVLAVRLALDGVGSWAMSKVIKHIYRRPRPRSLIDSARGRGKEAAGLGYVSGHAGVAVALGVAAFAHLGPRGRAVTLVAVPTIGLARIYVGAHLPLDVVGGAAMGLAVDALVSRHTVEPVAARRAKPAPNAPHRSAE